VRDAIAALLVGCHSRSCVAVDVGPNVGWMGAYMLALGATVHSYEPQSDLSKHSKLRHSSIARVADCTPQPS
jgi:hypothetical protein